MTNNKIYAVVTKKSTGLIKLMEFNASDYYRDKLNLDDDKWKFFATQAGAINHLTSMTNSLLSAVGTMHRKQSFVTDSMKRCSEMIEEESDPHIKIGIYRETIRSALQDLS